MTIVNWLICQDFTLLVFLLIRHLLIILNNQEENKIKINENNFRLMNYIFFIFYNKDSNENLSNKKKRKKKIENDWTAIINHKY